MTNAYDISMTDIQIPERPKRYFRVQLRVDLRAADATQRVIANGTRLVSLSASGIGFVPTASVPKGAALQLEFEVQGPDVAVEVQTLAEVVRVIDDDFELYIGCRFIDFDPRAQQALLEVLEAIRDQDATDATDAA